MEFPRFVFLSPGKEKCQGGTFNTEIVKNITEFDAAIEAGFSATLPEALEAVKIIRTKALKIEAPKIDHKLIRRGK